MAQFHKFAIYSIAWHPKENKIVSVDAHGDVLLWDVEKGKLLDECTPGSNNSIYRVEWNSKDPSQLATGSSDDSWQANATIFLLLTFP